MVKSVPACVRGFANGASGTSGNEQCNVRKSRDANIADLLQSILVSAPYVERVADPYIYVAPIDALQKEVLLT